jgi:hypothetical protein
LAIISTNNRTHVVSPMKILWKYLLLIASAVLLSSAMGQQLSVNTKKIDMLIEEWNIIHNGRVLDGFENIYDDELLYYTERIPRSKVTSLKRQLFLTNPDYRQRITSDVKYTLYTNGLVKCEFTKDVWENSKWNSYPSYLLVGFKNKGYWIVGESDYITDKKFKYTPKTGKALDVEILSGIITSDTAHVKAKKISTAGVRSVPEKDVISLQKDQVYIVGGLLGVSVLILLISLSFKRKKKSAKKTTLREQSVNRGSQALGKNRDLPEEQLKVPEESYHLIEYQLKQSAFKAFVIKLFDPLSFTMHKPRAHAFLTQHGFVKELESNLEFEVNNNHSGPAWIAIQCLYKEDTGNEIRLFTPAFLQLLAQIEREIDLYFVIGIGGPPSTPDELYLIPSRQLKSERVRKEDLKAFRRSGRFFYNTEWQRLQ